MIEGISAVTLGTHEMLRAVRFYRALGFAVLHGGEESSFTSFRAGTSYSTSSPSLPSGAGPGGGVIFSAVRDLAGSDRWRTALAGVELNRQAGDPGEYLDLLARRGLAVDAWETTYLHVLPGPDPVTEWYKGTGLRPVLAALPANESAEFIGQYRELAQAAYPAEPYGTVLPFRRVFVVAHKA